MRVGLSLVLVHMRYLFSGRPGVFFCPAPQSRTPLSPLPLDGYELAVTESAAWSPDLQDARLPRPLPHATEWCLRLLSSMARPPPLRCPSGGPRLRLRRAGGRRLPGPAAESLKPRLGLPPRGMPRASAPPPPPSRPAPCHSTTAPPLPASRTSPVPSSCETRCRSWVGSWGNSFVAVPPPRPAETEGRGCVRARRRSHPPATGAPESAP